MKRTMEQILPGRRKRIMEASTVLMNVVSHQQAVTETVLEVASI